MREIKFRAWDKEEKVMCYDIPTFTDDFTDMLNRTIKYHQDNDLVLMQYTGLKDKNGKEIYEGDIIKYSMGNTMQSNPMVVSFEEIFGLLGEYCNSYYATNKNSFEVIGNIYQNPELIGQ